jgi:hypothetical protein
MRKILKGLMEEVTWELVLEWWKDFSREGGWVHRGSVEELVEGAQETS